MEKRVRQYQEARKRSIFPKKSPVSNGSISHSLFYSKTNSPNFSILSPLFILRPFFLSSSVFSFSFKGLSEKAPKEITPTRPYKLRPHQKRQKSRRKNNTSISILTLDRTSAMTPGDEVGLPGEGTLLSRQFG